MGDRYYAAMLKEIGKTILRGKVVDRNKKPVKYTQEFKDLVIKQYLESDPTPNNTVELCKSIADEHDVSSNVIRKLLVDAEVYISQGQVSSKKSTSTKLDKSKMQSTIQEVIAKLGEPVNDDIILKLTGKAANYLTGVLSVLNKKETPNPVSEPKTKADQIALLDKMIFTVTETVADVAITSKLTGKAALYFANIIEKHEA